MGYRNWFTASTVVGQRFIFMLTGLIFWVALTISYIFLFSSGCGRNTCEWYRWLSLSFSLGIPLVFYVIGFVYFLVVRLSLLDEDEPLTPCYDIPQKSLMGLVNCWLSSLLILTWTVTTQEDDYGILLTFGACTSAACYELGAARNLRLGLSVLMLGFGCGLSVALSLRDSDPWHMWAVGLYLLILMPFMYFVEYAFQSGFVDDSTSGGSGGSGGGGQVQQGGGGQVQEAVGVDDSTSGGSGGQVQQGGGGQVLEAVGVDDSTSGGSGGQVQQGGGGQVQQGVGGGVQIQIVVQEGVQPVGGEAAEL